MFSYPQTLSCQDPAPPCPASLRVLFTFCPPPIEHWTTAKLQSSRPPPHVSLALPCLPSFCGHPLASLTHSGGSCLSIYPTSSPCFFGWFTYPGPHHCFCAAPCTADSLLADVPPSPFKTSLIQAASCLSSIPSCWALGTLPSLWGITCCSALHGG